MFLNLTPDYYSWMGCNGVRWRDKSHHGTVNFGFGRKSIVTMTLDLAQADGGSLNVSVDGSEPETLFSQMLSADNTSFVPAACIKKPGSVRFVGIMRLR